jgi:NADPH-dependent 7-cyano-7-deazaguanine reductase QueF
VEITLTSLVLCSIECKKKTVINKNLRFRFVEFRTLNSTSNSRMEKIYHSVVQFRQSKKTVAQKQVGSRGTISKIQIK